jgi:hypothetical protein
MFVPSLSWQNDAVIYINGAKSGASLPRRARAPPVGVSPPAMLAIGTGSSSFHFKKMVLPRQARDKHRHKHKQKLGDHFVPRIGRRLPS